MCTLSAQLPLRTLTHIPTVPSARGDLPPSQSRLFACSTAPLLAGFLGTEQSSLQGEEMTRGYVLHPDGLFLRALSSSDMPFPYRSNQQSKHDVRRVKIRPTDLTRLPGAERVHPHAPSCPSRLPRTSANPSSPQAVTVPKADCEPGTPDTRVGAVITQCIIWLLNGLFTKVCMMKSQASQSQDEAGWEEGGNH